MGNRFSPDVFFWDRWQQTRRYLVDQLRRLRDEKSKALMLEMLCMLDPDFSFLELVFGPSHVRIFPGLFGEAKKQAEMGSW